MKVSVYKNGFDSESQDVVPLEKVVKAIRGDEKGLGHRTALAKGLYAKYMGLEEGTPEYQKALDAYRKFKAAQLAGITPAGVFSHREKVGISEPSGLVVIDIDHIHNAVEMRHTLAQDKNVVLCYVSPSGEGVKALYKVHPVPQNDAEFKDAWGCVGLNVSGKYKCKIDPSGKDISRLTFLAYDPECYYNPDAEPYGWTPLPKKPPSQRRSKDYARDDMGELRRALEFLVPHLQAGSNTYNDRLAVMKGAHQAGLPDSEVLAWWGKVDSQEKRIDQLPDDGGTADEGKATVFGIAKRYGYGFKQEASAEYQEWKAQRKAALDDAIRDRWLMGAGREPKALAGSVQNSVLALRALGLDESFRLNTWTDKIEYQENDDWLEYNDRRMAGGIRWLIERHYAGSLDFAPTVDALHNAIIALAGERAYNPAVDYLRSLEWDGVDRLTWLASDLFGTPRDMEDASQAYQETAQLFFMGVVVRALHPGAVFPYCPILQSDHQGPGKTDFLKMLAILPKGYSEGFQFDVFDVHKRLQERGRGRSVIELGEINNIGGKALSALKELISNESAENRMAYAREVTTLDFTHIMAGTTNNRQLFTDTDHRRFPVIPVKGDVNLKWMRDNREQVYAQIVKAYDMGYFNEADGVVAVRMREELWAVANEMSKAYELESSLGVALNEILRGKTSITSAELGKALSRNPNNEDGDPGYGKPYASQEFSREMQKLGWRNTTTRDNDGNKYRYWYKED